jgi:Zn-dependent protease
VIPLSSDLAATIHSASTWVLPVLVAITFHEAAHGFVAWRLGDDTAYRLGRVTFNPLRHIDPFGTILLPALLLVTRAGFLFGWAKPVPVRFARLRNPRPGMILVAAAGPLTNLGLAILSALLIPLAQALPAGAADWALLSLAHSIELNLVLAVFNMLPIPPLDGGRVLVGILPRSLARPLARIEPFGLMLLVLLIFILPFLGSRVGIDLDIFRWLVGVPVRYLFEFVALFARWT